MHDLVAIGEVMLRLSIPSPARFETARQLDVQVGGAEANVAAACARLGLRTTERPGDVPHHEGRDQRRDESLDDVEQHHGNRVACSCRPPDVRRPDVAAADLADVLAAEDPNKPVAARDAAGQVAGEDEERSVQGVIWYPLTQALTASQSRLSKNASM